MVSRLRPDLDARVPIVSSFEVVDGIGVRLLEGEQSAHTARMSQPAVLHIDTPDGDLCHRLVHESIDARSDALVGEAQSTCFSSVARMPQRIATAKMLITSAAWGPKRCAPRMHWLPFSWQSSAFSNTAGPAQRLFVVLQAIQQC